MEYGVVVNNKFALFDNEDEDPLEVLQRTEEEAARKAKAAAVKENTAVSKSKVATKNAKNAAKTTKPEVKQPAKVLAPVQDQKVKPPAANQAQRRENVAEKPPRFRQNENTQQQEQQQRRPPRNENRDQQRMDTEFRPDRTEQRGEEFHGRGGGFRRGRGGQGRGGGSNEGGFDRFGKRDFERHSGSDRTGLKPIEKREGGGAHNWGTIADAVAEQEMLAANAAAAQDQRTDVDATTGEEQPAVDTEVTEAEDEKQLTLDEWKAMQERERAKPAFNIRKPGEGCQAAPEWKKMVALKKKVNTEDQDEEEEEEEEDDDEDHSRQKQTVPIQIRFNDTATRGGAGFRGRGGRGRGGRRQAADGGAERPRQSATKAEAVPNVDNEFDFPSLA